nr:hypothetical protein [uncultured Niameybacter sp.]
MNKQLSYLAKEEILKNEINNILMETKNELNNFKKEVERTESSFEDIKMIQKELSHIQNRLKNLEHIGTDVKKRYKAAGQMLEGKKKELAQINRDIVSEGKNQVMILIDNNLPDYMRLNSVEGEEDSCIIELISDKGIKSMRIGMVQFIENKHRTVVQVKMERDSEVKEFEVENPFRVYNIVNYIISIYGYKVNGKKLK